MQIPFLSLQRQYEPIAAEIDDAIRAVIADAAFVGGKYVTRFEQQFTEYLGIKYGAGVSSGTTALHTALLALGIGGGDEVLVPSYTFIATAEAVVMTGGIPVFVDSNSRSFSMDIDDLEKRITPNTRAIIVVHLHGMPADIAAIMAVAKKHRLKVVEDCAQSHGATFAGIKTGNFGDIACFSFYPGKNLGAYGDGGFVATNNEALAKRVRLIHDHGREEKYIHLESGYCYRLDGIQAAILSVKLRYLDEWTDRRRAVAARYFTDLNPKKFQLQTVEPRVRHVYHLFVMRVDNRERFMQHLADLGIQSGIHYPIPLHLQPAFKHLGYQKGDLKNAESICSNIISLPIFAEMTGEEIDRVIEAANSFES